MKREGVNFVGIIMALFFSFQCNINVLQLDILTATSYRGFDLGIPNALGSRACVR